jgi:hypothetical protein
MTCTRVLAMSADAANPREIKWMSFTGAFIAALGLVVLTRWFLHKPFLIAPMPRDTALGFVLCGSALLLTKNHPWTARSLGLVAGIMGLATLLGYVLAIDLHLHQIFGERFSPATGFPGSNVAFDRSLLHALRNIDHVGLELGVSPTKIDDRQLRRHAGVLHFHRQRA